MTRIIAAVGRVLSTRPAGHLESLHFHQGAQGNVAVCFHAGCDRPHLNV